MVTSVPHDGGMFFLEGDSFSIIVDQSSLNYKILNRNLVEVLDVEVNIYIQMHNFICIDLTLFGQTFLHTS